MCIDHISITRWVVDLIIMNSNVGLWKPKRKRIIVKNILLLHHNLKLILIKRPLAVIQQNLLNKLTNFDENENFHLKFFRFHLVLYCLIAWEKLEKEKNKKKLSRINVNIKKMLMLEYNMRAKSHVGSSRIIVIIASNKIHIKRKEKPVG